MEPDYSPVEGERGGLVALKRAFHWSRPLQIAGMILADAVIVAMAVGLAYLARFEGVVPEQFLGWVVSAVLVGIVVFVAFL